VDVLWFFVVGVMLIIYAVLDGFDLGAGAIQWLVGRRPSERQLVLRAIGPVWDCNEVWLIAASGTLFFAFPAVYASSFSGFYLPLMIVLWLLILRGLSVEVRSHLAEPLWHTFFDALFAGSSALLAILFGAALGNVIRGVPLGPDGYFFEPLWTTFTVTPAPGIIDWYTALSGLAALVILASHGAHFVALKTSGAVHDRAVRLAARLWLPTLALSVTALLATLTIRPGLLDNYTRWPAGWIIPAIVVASAVAMPLCRRARRDLAAFVASGLFIAAMLGGAAFALYPVLLPSSNTTYPSLTAIGTLAGPYGLSVGLRWWTAGFVLAVAYVVWIYRSLGAKVDATPESVSGNRA
jgi:cytochrome d ubiquinol oxidase subunit II